MRLGPQGPQAVVQVVLVAGHVMEMRQDGGVGGGGRCRPRDGWTCCGFALGARGSSTVVRGVRS